MLYRVRKTGSIASNDVRMRSGRTGLLRPFGSKEVHFHFQPSLPGAFCEKLVLENVQDASMNIEVTIKAYVRKLENFTLRDTVLDFGTVLINETSSAQKVVLTNTSTRPREFEIRPEGSSNARCNAEFSFTLEAVSAAPVSASTREEEIEKLIRKLKIAERKKKTSKIVKIKKKIASLQADSDEDAPGSKSSGGYFSDELSSDDESLYSYGIHRYGL